VLLAMYLYHGRSMNRTSLLPTSMESRMSEKAKSSMFQVLPPAR